MRSLTRVGIVTPSFNSGRYLARTVQSVLAQQGADVDYLIMDGNSSDGSLELLRRFGPRLHWISEPDRGQSDAINKGLARVGDGRPDEILGWLNADDTYAPDAVRHAVEIFERHPQADVVYGQATYIDADDRHIAPCVHIEPFDRTRLMRVSDFIVQPAAFFRRRAFDAVGGIDVSLNWMLDWDLWVKMARRGCRFVYTPKVLAHYRWLGDNKSASGGGRRLDEIDQTFAGYGLGPPAYIQLERCNLHLESAVRAWRGGKVGEGLAALRRIAGTLARSPGAVGAMFDPQTWRIIWTGQVLRARAARKD